MNTASIIVLIGMKCQRKNEFMAVIIEADKENQLCGYFRFSVNDQIVMVGLGLNPQFCGRGYEKQLMDLITQEFEKRFIDKILELEVRTFNSRAIQCYLSAGFSKLHTYTKKTPIGTDTFLLMRYDKSGNKKSTGFSLLLSK